MRVVARRLLLIGLSFCAGLMAFYVPERAYRSLPEVWLPVSARNISEALNLPVSSKSSAGVIMFSPLLAASPQIAEMRVGAGLTPANCPDVFGAGSLHPTPCQKNKSEGTQIYTIVRRNTSLDTEAFMQRGQVLVAANGFYDRQSAIKYMANFVKIARRDVNTQLGQNRKQASSAVTNIQNQKRAAQDAGKQAYKYLPFTPVLPTTLPAGWYQQVVRIGGSDPKHPTRVEVFYKKGGRSLSVVMVPRSQMTLGKTCGPMPGSGASVPCTKTASHDYYSGGINDGGSAAWYVYRPVGDVVAVVQLGVFDLNGRALLLSNKDLAIQQTIASSLRPASKDHFKGANFLSSALDPFPDIQP